MRRALVALALSVAGGCNDPADFRAAQGVSDLPKTVENAKRLYSTPNDCTVLGTVLGASVKDVAITVANHGGTHFLVTDDRKVQEFVTSNDYRGGPAYAQQGSSLYTRKEVSAEAYYCAAENGPRPSPDGGDSP